MTRNYMVFFTLHQIIKKPKCIISMIGLVFILSTVAPRNSNAQVFINCSDMEVVFSDLNDKAEVKHAVIVADSTGAAHLFWLYQQSNDDSSTWSINYARWENGTWSAPTDILLVPGGGPGEPHALYRSNGYLYVFWIDAGSIWYSSAPVTSASDIKTWSSPTPIISSAIDMDISIDEFDRFHLVYATGQPGGPLYYLNSEEGENWSPSVLVYQDAPQDATSNIPRISVANNRINITWTLYKIPEGWPPLGQLYSSSPDDGITWSSAIMIGEGEQGQGGILAFDDQIHIVWRGTSAAGNTYHMWSLNGGQTWLGPGIFDPDGGFSGAQSLAVDSGKKVHLVRADGGYQIWDGNQWAPVPAQFADSGEIGTLAIGLGNEVHWINSTPTDAQGAMIWHRLCLSDTPKIDSEEIPLLKTKSVAETSISTQVPLQPTTSAIGNSEVNILNQNTGTPIIIAAITVIGFFAVILIFRMIIKRPFR